MSTANAAEPQRAVPFLWFQNQAEEAAILYTDLFGGQILHVQRAGDQVISCTFQILGLRLIAMNGNRGAGFTDAASILVPCETQEEIDRVWDTLTAAGGAPGQCGWLRDRYGLAWQVVPANLPSLLENPRAIPVMLGMSKLDIAALAGA